MQKNEINEDCPSNPNISEPNQCKICSKPSLLKCSACSIPYYCSREHQKLDWVTHKVNCTPYILKESPELGRYFIAARKLEPGFILTSEKPIFGGPTLRNEDYDFNTPLCVSCCTPMVDDPSHRCSRCIWPVCNLKCQEAPHHSSNECLLFAQHKIPFPPKGIITPRATYKVIRLLRGLLLREKDPPLWTSMMNLQYETTNLKIRDTLELWEPLRVAMGLNQVPELGNDQDWSRIDGIFRVNAFGLVRQEHGKPAESMGRFLYLNSSMMAHSCLANCTWGMSYSPDFIFQIRTSFAIPKGSILSVTYNQDLTLLGTWMRQERTLEGFGFICKCPRCLDPTELGTFSSHIKCQEKYCEGYLSSTNPLDPGAFWRCFTCSGAVPSIVNESIIETIYLQILEKSGDRKNVIQNMEELIKEHQNLLHPNHWLLQEASRYIIVGYSELFPNLTSAQLNKFICHVEYLLKLRHILSPGISAERGKLQLKLAQCLFRRNEAEVNGSGEESQKKWRDLLELLEGALDFWKDDITNTPLDRECPPEADLIVEKIKKCSLYLQKKIMHIKC